MKYLLLALAVSGCASQPNNLGIVHPSFMLHIRQAPEQLEPNQNGTATLMQLNGQRVCVVNLREYPRCLLHEVRHCIEGAWHDERPNSEDC